MLHLAITQGTRHKEDKALISRIRDVTLVYGKSQGTDVEAENVIKLATRGQSQARRVRQRVMHSALVNSRFEQNRMIYRSYFINW